MLRRDPVVFYDVQICYFQFNVSQDRQTYPGPPPVEDPVFGEVEGLDQTNWYHLLTFTPLKWWMKQYCRRLKSHAIEMYIPSDKFFRQTQPQVRSPILLRKSSPKQLLLHWIIVCWWTKGLWWKNIHQRLFVWLHRYDTDQMSGPLNLEAWHHK